ncbi:MAG: hypothetical protein DRZ79_00765 [Candidatus Cloacimonadota bacterium]|nr:MAG: hypothetical protein DRZ79_00765 [Candidatus Cloacimonadota bacterium]
MKRNIIFFLIIISFLVGSCKREPKDNQFPQKPIKIIVYTGPGGLIDNTARKFAQIASKYTDAVFVVENKPGAGGIRAMKRVLQMPADGYTLFACTKSNISKIVASKGAIDTDDFTWLAMMMADPECVITNRKAKINSWEDIVADAKKKNGKQIWVGPATGGLDHVMAMKTWDKFGFKANWIPFKSGGKAKGVLLGGMGVAYVGNPRDILGNKNLKIAAVSSPHRLERFPDAPTFAELGAKDFDHEIMWRGFAIKKGVPEHILKWYDDLFRKVNDDPEWRSFWEKGGIEVVYKGPQEFSTIIKQDIREFSIYLQRLGTLGIKHQPFLKYFAVLAIFILLFVRIFLNRTSYREFAGGITIPLSFIFLIIIFYLVSLNFPEGTKVGPAVVPRLWMFVLIPLNLYLLVQALRKKTDKDSEKGNTKIVFTFIALLVFYLVALVFIGYFISTFIFIFVSMLILGYRKYVSMVIISAIWIIFSYFVFYKLLQVPLPVGSLIELLM